MSTTRAIFDRMISAIRLPSTLQRRLNETVHSLLYGESGGESHFNRPFR